MHLQVTGRHSKILRSSGHDGLRVSPQSEYYLQGSEGGAHSSIMQLTDAADPLRCVASLQAGTCLGRGTCPDSDRMLKHDDVVRSPRICC